MTGEIVEQRRFERYSLHTVEVSGRMLFSSRVKLLDLSIAGISVEVDKRLNIGIDYQVKVENGGDPLSLKSKVVWSSLIKTEEGGNGEIVPIYRAGLQFNALSEAQARELTRFIRACTGQDIQNDMHKQNNLRCTVRYDIAQLRKEGELSVGTPPQYKVKVIGLGGMLLCCDRPLKAESRYPMEIVAPGGEVIKFLGRIASCKVDGQGGGGYDIGVEFLDLSAGQRSALVRLIRMAEAQGK